MIRRGLFFMVLMLAAVTAAAGQSVWKDRPPLRERMFFGGGFGLQFGTITNIELSPLLGVYLLPRVAVAGGPTFQYYSDQYNETTLYGGKGYLQITLIQSLNNIIPIGLNTGVALHGEYEGLSLEKAYFTGIPDDTGRIFSGAFLGGVSIVQPTGMRSSINISLLWCLAGNPYDFYDNPEVRISFLF